MFQLTVRRLLQRPNARGDTRFWFQCAEKSRFSAPSLGQDKSASLSATVCAYNCICIFLMYICMCLYMCICVNDNLYHFAVYWKYMAP